MAPKKMNQKLLYALIVFILLLALSYFIPNFSTFGDTVDRTKCPYKTEGNSNADFTIKYVDSPYCFWCWLEEPILENVVNAKGNSFKLERYDIRYCTDIVRKYKFSGTPSFVFSMDNGTKEHSQVGFIREEMFFKIICEVTGDCSPNQND